MGMRALGKSLVLAAWFVALSAPGASAQVLERGTIIDRVQCAGDAEQTYALYLPSTYSPDRKWSLVLAFHPAARGRLMVEKLQAAAEQYGYIVAASNNSRNGPHAVSQAAARAMSTDVGQRFSIDPQRVYLAGMSGGARVATGIALANNNIAGVIASSAGYPDSQPRASVPFAIFGTAGTEDFNYIEMRLLDRKLSSPHFLAVFPGGHTLPPDDVAFDALEWMELQAMQSRRRGRDDMLVGRMVEKRRARIAAGTGPAATVYLLTALVADFKGLADVSAEAARLDQMSRQADVKKALKREHDSDTAEGRMLEEIFTLETRLGTDDGREIALMMLRERLSKLARKAKADADTPERSQARRVLRSVTAGASGRVQDREYLTLLEQYRQPGR
jgi:pimeloyl-ACP methyl ester carboxylesterase